MKEKEFTTKEVVSDLILNDKDSKIQNQFWDFLDQNSTQDKAIAVFADFLEVTLYEVYGKKDWYKVAIKLSEYYQR